MELNYFYKAEMPNYQNWTLEDVYKRQQQWQDHFGQKRYVPQRAGMQEAESQTRALFR